MTIEGRHGSTNLDHDPRDEATGDQRTIIVGVRVEDEAKGPPGCPWLARRDVTNTWEHDEKRTMREKVSGCCGTDKPKGKSKIREEDRSSSGLTQLYISQRFPTRVGESRSTLRHTLNERKQMKVVLKTGPWGMCV